MILLHFKTSYVEVYLLLCSFYCPLYCYFKTSYVEVYLFFRLFGFIFWYISKHLMLKFIVGFDKKFGREFFYFKTSYVEVYRSLIHKYFILWFISKHLMLKFIDVANIFPISKIFISKHLMLKFIKTNSENTESY